jgi:GMP synthase (glutamine-hydrolysing)
VSTGSSQHRTTSSSLDWRRRSCRDHARRRGLALPPGAAWLGSGEVYPHQAFRIGDTSWGVQFHPELNHGGYQMWVDSNHGASPVNQRRLREGGLDLMRNEDEVLRGNRELAHRFAAVLHARRAVSEIGSAS